MNIHDVFKLIWNCLIAASLPNFVLHLSQSSRRDVALLHPHPRLADLNEEHGG
jgi:hypothetical protein